jgi:hypothetical protein
MLYVGPFHALAGSAKVYPKATNARHDPNGLIEVPLALGAAVNVVGYWFTNQPVQSSDRGAGAGAGPDLVWWKMQSGYWVEDANLDTTGLSGAPLGAAVSTMPAGMTTYFEPAGAQSGGVTMTDVQNAIAGAIAKLRITSS